MVPRRYFILILIPIALMIAGTAGYYFLDDRYSLIDALYMTVITLTTVGYEEVYPLTPSGRIFTIVLLLVGVLTFFYAVTELVRVVISGEVQQLLGRRRMERSLTELKNHMIICGYGRMGRRVCGEFSRRGLPFVVIDRRADLLRDFDLAHGFALEGDATSDAVLRHAGVERARALVTVAASDADNLFITLSARLLNDKLFIVARAEGELAEEKLCRAGASRVVTPYAIGGLKVAMAVLRPAVVDFIELATGAEQLDLQIEETLIHPHSHLAGVTLHASGLRQDLGVIVVAIKKENGQLVANPPHDAVMTPGDTLITLGARRSLDRVEILANRAA
ncbi:MAG TPA: NAD-binding protein [Gemmataceae bacterium]|nr:NAD-binding protein [Gemmataceae bacterium]